MLRINFPLTCSQCGYVFYAPMPPWRVLQWYWANLRTKFQRRMIVMAICEDCEVVAKYRYRFWADQRSAE